MSKRKTTLENQLSALSAANRNKEQVQEFFINAIKKEIEASTQSEAEIAHTMGVSKKALFLSLHGGRSIGLPVMINIATAMGMELSISIKKEMK